MRLVSLFLSAWLVCSPTLGMVVGRALVRTVARAPSPCASWSSSRLFGWIRLKKEGERFIPRGQREENQGIPASAAAQGAPVRTKGGDPITQHPVPPEELDESPGGAVNAPAAPAGEVAAPKVLSKEEPAWEARSNDKFRSEEEENTKTKPEVVLAAERAETARLEAELAVAAAETHSARASATHAENNGSAAATPSEASVPSRQRNYGAMPCDEAEALSRQLADGDSPELIIARLQRQDAEAEAEARRRREALEAYNRIPQAQRSAERWGSRNPAATDFLRRDAAELAWRDRHGLWEGARPSPQLAAGQVGREADEALAPDSDPRLSTFERWMKVEQQWRRELFARALRVIDETSDLPDEADFLIDEEAARRFDDYRAVRRFEANSRDMASRRQAELRASERFGSKLGSDAAFYDESTGRGGRVPGPVFDENEDGWASTPRSGRALARSLVRQPAREGRYGDAERVRLPASGWEQPAGPRAARVSSRENDTWDDALWGWEDAADNVARGLGGVLKAGEQAIEKAADTWYEAERQAAGYEPRFDVALGNSARQLEDAALGRDRAARGVSSGALRVDELGALPKSSTYVSKNLGPRTTRDDKPPSPSAHATVSLKSAAEPTATGAEIQASKVETEGPISKVQSTPAEAGEMLARDCLPDNVEADSATISSSGANGSVSEWQPAPATMHTPDSMPKSTTRVHVSRGASGSLDEADPLSQQQPRSMGTSTAARRLRSELQDVREEDEGDLEWLLGPAAVTAASARAAEQERCEYVSRRLRRLHERVLDRVDALQASEDEAADQLRVLRSTLRSTRADYAWPASLDGLGPAEFEQQERAIRQMEEAERTLNAQRAAVGDALAVAVDRLEELQLAGRMLRLGGTPAIRDALSSRDFSPPLHDFLRKLVA